jgi:hypothetical protein
MVKEPVGVDGWSTGVHAEPPVASGGRVSAAIESIIDRLRIRDAAAHQHVVDFARDPPDALLDLVIATAANLE